MVEGHIRRERILDILKNSSVPVSGSRLSKELGVSRQVIVQLFIKKNGPKSN